MSRSRGYSESQVKRVNYRIPKTTVENLIGMTQWQLIAAYLDDLPIPDHAFVKIGKEVRPTGDDEVEYLLIIAEWTD